MGILSIAPLDMIKKAIASGEISYLTKVSGIGKKIAERVIVELRDKMGKLDESAGAAFKDEQDVMEALKSLGYSPAEAREAIKKIPIDLTDNKTILVHQKMTGHFLYGNWKKESGKWLGKEAGAIRDDLQNRFIHLVFDLSNGPLR